MITRSSSKSPFSSFEIHKTTSSEKISHSDSPTSSILKSPTPIFVTTRSSSTKKLKFANGPVDLQTLKNGSSTESITSSDSKVETIETTVESFDTSNNGEISADENSVEVSVSPVKTMKISPDSWKAFLEYKKYYDYPNETEKTDYTYSRLSKFRHKEIIPGFLIRPNLSRSSISSRRSSSDNFLTNQSSFSDSYSYDFKINSSTDGEINNDSKVSSKTKTGSRSKYYLRSSSYGDADVGEIETKPVRYEKEYVNDSAPEVTFRKSASYTTEELPSSKIGNQVSSSQFHMNSLRALELDDDDIDEVDDPSVKYAKHYKGGSWHKDEIQSSRTAANFISTFFTSIFFYLTTVGSHTKDLFSRYILRRKDDYYSPGSYRYSRSLGSSMWKDKTPYSSGYYADRYYDLEESWYQRFFSYIQNKFSKFSNLIMGGSGSRYAAYSNQPSSKWRIWWLLLPLLLLAGFFLFKVEEKSGLISNQYKALDCQTNGLLTSLESKVKPIWKSGYVTYKKATAAANCYALDTYDRLKLPFVQGGEWMSSYFSSVDGPLMSAALGFWNTFSQGLYTIANAFQNAVFNFWNVLTDFFTDVLSAASNLLFYSFTYLKDIFFTVLEILKRFLRNIYDILKKSVLNIWSYLYLLLFSTKDNITSPIEMSEKVVDTLPHKSSVKLDDIKNIAWDLSNFKKRFDELESEFRKEKQSVQIRNDFYNKQFENNNLALQKYQTVLNRAVSSAKRPGSISNSTVQYLLDNHFNELKQWILENFMLKIDSPNLDEKKIIPIIAKHLNKTEEELMILKEEFKRFSHDHKVELRSVKKDFGSLITSNMGGDISDSYIKKIVNDAIKLYDADKTGRVDFALESAGGQVVSIRCTETYMASPKSYVLMGWPLFTKASSPRDAITHTTAAGQCWAFVGSQGFLVIQLSHNIKVTGFTMEHISRLLAPNGHIESAPKNFSMWGLKTEHDPKPYLFGEYTYLDNDETLQYFPVAHPTSEKYQMVELKIASNHGNPNYTCLYRIRVHGNLNHL